MRKLWVKAWMTLDGVFDADTVVPYIMGRGRRFFPDGTPPTKLRLVESKMLSAGTLALIYQPDKQ